MTVTILLFGPLAEMAGTQQLTLDASDSDRLLAALVARHPRLADESYAVAVNEQVIDGNTPLAPGATVALLPPFSGG